MLTASRTHSASHAALLKLAALAVIIALAFFAAWKTGLLEYTDLSKAATAVRDLRDVRFIIPLFVLAYALAATFGLPGSILTLVGGAMFGFGLGTLLNWFGATAGAIGAYTLARTLGRDAFRGVLGKYRDKLETLAEHQGFLAILRLRLIPVVPFNVLNFASGLAGVPARSYITATALGIIPGSAVYTYFADALLAGAEGAQEKALLRLGIAGALLVLLSFIPAIARKFGLGVASAAVITAIAFAPGRSAAQSVTVDHSSFDALLRANVVDGLVENRLPSATLGRPHSRSAGSAARGSGRYVSAKVAWRKSRRRRECTVHVSMIFTYYKADFSGNANIGRFIARWYEDDPERQLLNSGKFGLSKTAYNW